MTQNVPINKFKIQDIKSIFPYLTDGAKEYYEAYFSSVEICEPEASPNGRDQDILMIESDNSSGEESNF